MDTIKKYVTTMLAAVALLSLGSCVKDDLYATPHPDKGALVVTADFSELTEGIAVPDGYVVSVAGKDYSASSSAAFICPDLLPQGEYGVMAYNQPEGITIIGNLASAIISGGTANPLPGYLYSYSGQVDVEADDTTRLTMPMAQRVRDFYIRFTVSEGDVGRVEDVSGVISGVAGGFNLENRSVSGEAVDVEPAFSVNGDAVTSHLRLFGVRGGSQVLTLNVAFADGTLQTVESDITEFLQNFGSDMLTPLEMRGNLLLPLSAGFNITITDLETGEVENVDLY